MRTLSLTLLAGVLAAGVLAASPVYQINFTGTLNSGTVQDFYLPNNSVTTALDLTGLQVSGWIRYDLGQAPAAVVTTDASGFVNTAIQSSGVPVFVSESVQISGLSLPAGFLSLPSTFNMAPVPSVPAGSTLTQTTDSQFLRFSSKPSGAPQSVLASMDLAYSWTSPQFLGSQAEFVAILASNAQNLFPIPPAGSFPASWGPDTTGVNGVFGFTEFQRDLTSSNHFGVLADYSVSGNFALDSVSGGFVNPTPEPGAVLPLIAGLLVLAVRRRR